MTLLFKALSLPVLAFTFGIGSSAAVAQSTPPNQQSMPGMDMPEKPQPQPSSPAAPRQRSQPRTLPMPGDMQHPSSANKPAVRESQSMRASEAQQTGQRVGAAAASSDGASITHPTMTLQESENAALHTGQDLPAPDLLEGVSARPALSLQQFEAWGEHGNPTLAQARTLVQRSEAQSRQVALPPDPVVAYDGEHIRGGSYGGGEQGAYVQQTLVLGGKLAARRDIYSRQADVDRVGVEEQATRVRNDVQQAFYRALTSQATVVLRQRLLGTAADAVATAHLLSNVGQADAPDVLQAEVEAEGAKIDYVDAQRAFLQDFRSLSALVDQPELPVSPLQGELENPPQIEPEALVSQIVTGSPSVKRAQEMVAMAEAKIKDSRREAVPDLQLRAGEWWSGEQLNGTNKPAGPESFASAGVNLPLWNRNQGNKDAAQADLERARDNVLRTQLALRRRAEPFAQDYLSARFEADRYRTQLIPRARRAYELYTLKYGEMASAYPQVLVSQRTLFDLQVAYLRSLHREWMAAIALQNSTLSGGLDNPVSAGEDATTLNLPTASQ